MKLRLLNASHQGLCYFAYLAGLPAGARRRAATRCSPSSCWRTWIPRRRRRSSPCPASTCPTTSSTLIERFANPGVRDTIARLCVGSSDRIPKWLLPVIRENLATGGADPAVGGDRRELGPLRRGRRRAGRADRRPGPAGRNACAPGEVATRQSRSRSSRTPRCSVTSLDKQRFVEAYLWALDSLHRDGARATLETSDRDRTRDEQDMKPRARSSARR